jgi:formamidopyrimidine-DNA glycosylase
MPELPEVEIVRRQLEEKVRGRTIERVRVLEPKTVGRDKLFAKKIAKAQIESIDRVGKLLIFKLSKPDTYLLGHLKMTGQFIFNERGGGKKKVGYADLPNRHTRVVFYFKNGAELFFNDIRKFGYLKRATVKEARQIRQTVGIEPLSPGYTWRKFQTIFSNRTTSLKAILLNQALIAGLGNIYVDEACYQAGINPARRADSLSAKEKQKLFYACARVLKEALGRGGTTFRSFANVDGRKGDFASRLHVFQRQGQPCLRCGSTIQKIRVAGRGTHYCPSCQR